MWDDHGTRYDMMDGGGAGGFAMVALMILALALIAVLAYLFLHVSTGRSNTAEPSAPAPTEPEARRLLDRRLALGEISPEEYATVRSVLET